MNLRQRLLAVTLLLPSLAFAQPAAEAASPAPAAAAPATASAAAPAAAPPSPTGEATWSFGAGVGLSTLYLAYSTGLYQIGGSVPSATVYVPSAFVERRLTAKSWLVVGLSGGANSQAGDPPPTGTYGLLNGDSQWLSVSAGVRQVVWSRSLFDVSLLGLGELGVSSGHSRYQQYSGEVAAWDTSGWLAGASLGFAVDRELTPGLSVRLATPLLDASWRQGKSTQAGAAAIKTHALQVSAVLEPRLELRLAF
jgi:hypothetical protein